MMSTLSGKASRLSSKVSRIDRAAADRLFPRDQLLQWPEGYLPASGVAHLLQPDGVRFQDVLECYQDIKVDRQHELQRDFAADYTLWTRCALEAFARRLDTQGAMKRLFTRVTARDRLPRDSDVRRVFQLSPYLPPPPLKSEPINNNNNSSNVMKSAPASHYYEFQPYAATQEYAMMPVSGFRDGHGKVHFTTFPQLRNVLHTDFDAMSALRGLSMYTDDALLYTQESVQAIAMYVRRRLDEIYAKEESFLASARSSGAARDSEEGECSESPTFSRESPVVVFFGNGRLAWMLNESNLLPASVRAVQLPRQAAQRSHRHAHLQQLNQSSQFADQVGLHYSFSSIFPCETSSVGDALRKYRPAVVLVEPHVDRDYLSDLRGYYSVREVLVMGPVDSPAMASFAYPFLSFGVTPGPTTYWVYNENLQKVAASSRVQMPMDPPHECQGYEKENVDEISAWLIGANDCPVIGSQNRAVRFVRKVCPVLKKKK